MNARHQIALPAAISTIRAPTDAAGGSSTVFTVTRASRAQGVQVLSTFKCWGKIETRGNARLANVRMVQYDSVDPKAAPLMHVVGRLIGKATQDIRYHYLSFALVERLLWLINASRRSDVPDGFLVEIYNPTPQVVAAQLTFGVNRGMINPNMRSVHLHQLYTKRLEITPGYFRALIPIDEFSHIVSSGLQFAIAFTPEAKSDVHLVFLTLDLVRLRDQQQARTLQVGTSPAPLKARTTLAKPAVKCIVF